MKDSKGQETLCNGVKIEMPPIVEVFCANGRGWRDASQLVKDLI